MLIMINKGYYLLRLIPLLFLLLFFSRIYAQTTKKEKAKVFQFLKIELNLGAIYNDNILKYSDNYLTKFQNNEDEGRFHINTSDGAVLDQSIKLASTFLFFRKKKTILEGGFSRQEYLNNKIKTWNQIDFGLQQYITSRLVINLSYSYIPKYYVRHFRDEDWVDVYGYVPEAFQPFDFAKNEYGFWIQNTFFKKKKTKLRLSFDYEQYFYNTHFTEYDCNNLNFGAKFYQTIKKKLKVEVGYQFVDSKAKAYDEPQEIKEISDDADASYKADEFSGAIKWGLPNVFRRMHSIDADFSYRRSCFTTIHFLELDRLHAGRVDDLYKLGINYDFRISEPLTVSFYYKWYKLDSDTRAEENKEYVSQEKDYTQQLFGLKFTYIFKEITFHRSKPKTNSN